MKMKTIFSIVALFTWGIMSAQNVQIDRIDVRGNKIIVRYTLSDDNPNHKYSINLYSSVDNFSRPLTNVTDDVGPDVHPGGDKKITWSFANEIGNFKGSISLEIRGDVVAPFLRVSEKYVQKSYRRGKSYPLQWTSGNTLGQISIELYKGNELTWKANNVPNNGKYNLVIPSKTKTGSGYRLKFVNSNDDAEFIFSPEFAIRHKTPFIMKVGAVAIIGVGVSVLGGGGSSGGDDSNTGTKLADPPVTPGG